MRNSGEPRDQGRSARGAEVQVKAPKQFAASLGPACHSQEIALNPGSHCLRRNHIVENTLKVDLAVMPMKTALGEMYR